MEEKKIILLDGGVGTCLWNKAQAKGEEQVPVWRYNIEDPDIVRELENEYVEAGSDIIYTNTFSANRPSVAPSGYTVEQIVRTALEIAHDTVDGRAKVALDIGCLTGMLKPFGNISDEECYEYFDEMLKAGAAGKPDLIVLETFMDLKMLQIAAKAASKYDIPMMFSMSFAKVSARKGARTMFGNGTQDVVDGLKEYEPVGIGLNCSMGPDETLPIIREFSEITDIPLIFKPNAGMPTIEGGSEVDFEDFANDIMKAVHYKGVKYVGGCCGSDPRYIACVKKKLEEI